MIIYDKMIIQLFPSRLIIKQVTLDFEKVLWVFQLQNGSSKIVIGEGWFVPSFNHNTVNQRRMIEHFSLHHVSTADDKQMSELTQAFEVVRGGQLH